MTPLRSTTIWIMTLVPDLILVWGGGSRKNNTKKGQTKEQAAHLARFELAPHFARIYFNSTVWPIYSAGTFSSPFAVCTLSRTTVGMRYLD